MLDVPVLCRASTVSTSACEQPVADHGAKLVLTRTACKLTRLRVLRVGGLVAKVFVQRVHDQG